MNTSVPTTNQEQERRFLPQYLSIDNWETVEPYFKDLLDRPLENREALENWLKDRSELDAVLSEDLAWRYIKSTINTKDEEAAQAFKQFISEIKPKIAPLDDKLNRKLLEVPFLDELEQEEGYRIFIREVRTAIELYREENIPLIAKTREKAQEFGNITGAMSIELDGKELTLQQASTYLRDPNRALRDKVFHLVKDRRLQDKDTLDSLFDELTELRHNIATNAGFDNYRDFSFRSMGRFDYTPEDCFAFHESIRTAVKPLVNQLHEERKEQLGVETLKPWDTAVDPTGTPPLKPFSSEEEMVDKTIELFSSIRPFFGDCLATMKEMGHLDLWSKSGKAPGGYNYPLMETGAPFIFMNGVGDHSDLVTMVHEGGHAVHSFFMQGLELTYFKSTPSEVAELASMAMELISMDFWHLVYDNEEDLKRAKKAQMERALSVLPWIATIDKFQHWVYTHPEHTVEERTENWQRIAQEFGSDVVDHSGEEDLFAKSWQKQLHLFEVPFYYIEYGMAQLGALALWRNYRQNPEKALDRYSEALKLGYTRTIPAIYEAAGIKFDFSQNYVEELTGMVKEELDELNR